MIIEITLTLLALVLLYFGFRIVRAVALYLKLRGLQLLTCPETKKLVLVQVDAGAMARETILNGSRFRIRKCCRWPMRQCCGQDCLRQLENHSPEVRFCVACKHP